MNMGWRVNCLQITGRGQFCFKKQLKVASVPSFITAAIGTYFVFSRLKPVRNVALRAPPVPTKPVTNPDIHPPEITVHKLVGNFSFSLTKNETEIKIKNIPRITLRVSCEIIPTREAPRKLSQTLGIPNVIIIFLSNPCLKKIVFGFLVMCLF